MEPVSTGNAVNAETNSDCLEAAVTKSFTVRNFLNRKTHRSPTFYVGNSGWQIVVKRHPSQSSRALGLFLKCFTESVPASWRCFASAEISLNTQWDEPNIYHQDSDQTLTRNISHLYTTSDDLAGFLTFITWEDLFDPRRGFVIDNTIKITVNLKVYLHPEIMMNIEGEEVKCDREAVVRFTINNVGRKAPLMSSEFQMHKLPWQIFIEPFPLRHPKRLNFFLKCNGDPKHPSWECFAEVELRVINQTDNGGPLTGKSQHLFCKIANTCSFRNFISWKKLFKEESAYSKKKSLKFEITVNLNPSVVLQNWNPERYQTEGTVCCIVYNISQLQGTTIYSTSQYISNLPWRIMVKRLTTIGPSRKIQSYLSVYLQCTEESDPSPSWTCNATIKLVLKSQQPNKESFWHTTEYLFQRTRNTLGLTHFHTWNELFDPGRGYIKHDYIILEVHLKVDETSGIE